MTFSVEDHGIVSDSSASVQDFVCPQEILINFDHLDAIRSALGLGRKNFLYVGDEDAGANIAGLYSLVATCEAVGKNPLAYLTDVLGRIGSHPNDRMDELLPQHWKPPATPAAGAGVQ